MRKLKKFTIFFTLFLQISLLSTSLPAFAAFSPAFDIHSEGVYMVNTDTDTVIISKNADKKMYPASTTKIMTCLVCLEKVKDFNAKVDCDYKCFDEFNADNPNYCYPSNAEIDPLQGNLTYTDCLYALMLASACEAANILAYNVGGESIDNFIAMMNETAKKIGCKNTHFSNAHGLFDEENYTTPYDMYLITRYAVDNYPGFMKICGTYEYNMPANSKYPTGYCVTHTNKLMLESSDYYCEGVKGVKTGSIDYYYYKKDGSWDWDEYKYGSRALVTTAERDGYNYMIVTLGAPYYNADGTYIEDQLNFVDHKNLYEWAFDEFEYSQIIEKNRQIMQVDVLKGKDCDTVGIITTDEFFMLIPKSLDSSAIQLVKPKISEMTAPISRGTRVGTLELRMEGDTIAEIPLITESEIELDVVAEYKEKLGNIISSPQFIVLSIILVLLIITYFVLRGVLKSRRAKQSEMQRRRKIMSTRGSVRNGSLRSNKKRYNNKNIRRK